MSGKMIIISAPSGAGKTTIVKSILHEFPQLAFSVSATTRSMRAGEQNGKDYYFLTSLEFKKRMDEHSFIEYEQVYEGLLYGTLKSEVDRIWAEKKVVIFDVDVKGGMNIKQQYPKESCSIFIKPPSIEELERRLRGRGTDDEQTIKMRMDRASEELTYESMFDVVIVNDLLDEAIIKTKMAVQNFIN